MATKLKKNKSNNVYQDSNNAEERLLNIFNSKDVEPAIQLALDSEEWEMKYHLDRTRQNIVNWKDFGQNKRILEIGAGTGIITEALCSTSNNNSIYSVELSPKRSEVLKARCKNFSNLTVINTNLQDLDKSFLKSFDYIVVIGVLEYSGKYIDSEKPYNKFLKEAKSFLNSKGEIILAIENKYGLKYWSGAPEDHLNRPFESIENYPNQWLESHQGIKTFSKIELQEIFEEVGYKDIVFYYPLPDYKLPKEIFSQEYLPSINHPILSSSLNIFNLDNSKILFNQVRTMEGLVRNGMFEFFANSFLISAKV